MTYILHIVENHAQMPKQQRCTPNYFMNTLNSIKLQPLIAQQTTSNKDKSNQYSIHNQYDLVQDQPNNWNQEHSINFNEEPTHNCPDKYKQQVQISKNANCGNQNKKVKQKYSYRIECQQNEQECKAFIEQFNSRMKNKKRNQKPRKRLIITNKVIEQLQSYFQEYNCGLHKQSPDRIKFKDIAEKIGTSPTQIKNLFQEFTVDPLFSNRINQMRENYLLHRETPSKTAQNSHFMTKMRLQFIKDIIRQKGRLTETEIAQEMSKIDQLHYRDQLGNKIRISQPTVQRLMKIIIVKPRCIQLSEINTPQHIKNRHKYSQAYIKLRQGRQIYFMGEYSFACNLSLSNCSPRGREYFCNSKLNNNKDQQNWSRHLQYLIVISANGLIYYQLFNNIFEQINFRKSLNNIANHINQRSQHPKKYLVLQSIQFHNKAELQLFEKTYLIRILFLPPECPVLNPTEYLFRQIQDVSLSKSKKDSFGTDLQQLLVSLKDKSLQCYFQKVQHFLDLSERQEVFK